MLESSTADPRIGSVLQDRYRVTELLSSGGMGVVYRGERVELGRQVAIKFLHAAFSTHRDFLERFEREARLMSRLEHPNIVSVIDFGVVDGAPYIVMDFVAGNTLQELIEAGPMPIERAAKIADQILAALAHAHARNVIHRDVKPANVMLTSTEGAVDHVRLLDFGLGKLRDVEASLTSAAVGTPSYMSPEQAAGGNADARSDIYSAGVVLFELLTGTKPFTAEQPLAVLRMHMAVEPPRLADRNPELEHAGLEAVLARCLAKKPGDRYQTPAAMRAELAAAVAGGAIAPPRPDRPAPRPATRPAVRRGSGGGLGWLVLALAAAGGGYYWLVRPAGTPLAGVHQVIDERRDAEEIRALNALLGQRPELGRRLGDLYFEKRWWAEGLAAYGKALTADSSLARDRTLVANAIRALGEPAVEDRARALLVNQVGRPALSALRRARASKPSPAVDRAIAELERR